MSAYYLIGIDETGTFDQTRMSRIGGVVLKNCSRENLQAIIQAVCDQHQYPGLEQDLGRLHYTDAKNDKKIIHTVGPDGLVTEVPHATRMAVIRDILARSQDVCSLYFISTGFPHFFSHEQDAYFTLLRTTLWGLLTHQAFPLQSGDRVMINITKRNQSAGMFGTWQVHNDDYYLFIAQQLEREFARLKEEKGLSLLEFRFGQFHGFTERNVELISPELTIGQYLIYEWQRKQAEGDIELMLADYVVGNSRAQGDQRQPLSYLEIPFDDYCHLLFGTDRLDFLIRDCQIGTDRLDFLIRDCQKGMIPVVPTLLTLLRMYAVEKNATTQGTIKTYLAELLDKVNGQWWLQDEFRKTLDSTLQSLITNHVQDQQSLTIVKQYCDVLLEMLTKKQTGSFSLCVRNIIYRYRIKIANLKGMGVDAIPQQEYYDFFQKYREILYPDMAERAKLFLETEYHIAQIVYFNVYNFEEAIRVWSGYEKSYRKLIQLYVSDNTPSFLTKISKKDASLGQICSNLGQAHAFVYSLQHQDKDYEAAWLYLEDSTNQFISKSLDWSREMHYRVHLELCKGNLTSAWNMLKDILGNPPLPPEPDPAALVRWMIKQKISSPWDISLFVKFLGYCKHADHTKNAHPTCCISRQDWQALLSLVQTDWSVYPKCNILKWMAYLAVNTETKSAVLDKEKHETEIGLAQEALALPLLDPAAFDIEKFTLQTIQIPLLMLQAWLKSEQPKKTLQRLQALMSQQPSFREYMKEYGWETKFPDKTTKNWNLWDIVVMLPFYYA